MTGFTDHSGILAPLIEDNVNTDAIIPSREMKRVSKTGLAEGLFGGLRYTSGRIPNPDFVLNRAPHDKATILLSGRNFGCGSSREHAVWALKDYGFRAVLAESFGAIFYDNCVANGVAPVTLPGEVLRQIADWCAEDPVAHRLVVDLAAMEVRAGPVTAPFELSEQHRTMLVEGLSPIDVTLQDGPRLDAFAARDAAARPWLYPSR